MCKHHLNYIILVHHNYPMLVIQSAKSDTFFGLCQEFLIKSLNIYEFNFEVKPCPRSRALVRSWQASVPAGGGAQGEAPRHQVRLISQTFILDVVSGD